MAQEVERTLPTRAVLLNRKDPAALPERRRGRRHTAAEIVAPVMVDIAPPTQTSPPVVVVAALTVADLMTFTAETLTNKVDPDTPLVATLGPDGQLLTIEPQETCTP